VCLGACVFTIISIYGFPTFAPGDNVNPMQATGIRDTGRVAAQIVTGIGFIGAGTVLRNGPIVLGLTTAATLWLAASIGMACGAGMFDIAFAGTCLAVLTLVIVRIFERKVFPNSIKRTRRIRISLICTPEEVDIVQDFLLNKYKNLIELTKRPQEGEPSSVKLACVVDLSVQKSIKDLYKTFQKQDGIISVSIREFNEV
jgi:putative Mg2+ transporter-C (MgtC) family protein